MAWDRKRPYAPFTVYKEGTIMYGRGARGRMESFSYVTLSKEDIGKVWESGAVKCSELVDGASESCEFRAFKDVELELEYVTFERGRSGISFIWKDGSGTEYPMFATEVDRLIRSGMMSRKIRGLWSAEKRGQNYGVMLEELLWREH